MKFISDHHNKPNIPIKLVTQYFWFPSIYKSCVYIILYSIVCDSMSKNLHTLIKKYFTDKQMLTIIEPVRKIAPTKSWHKPSVCKKKKAMSVNYNKTKYAYIILIYFEF